MGRPARANREDAFVENGYKISGCIVGVWGWKFRLDMRWGLGQAKDCGHRFAAGRGARRNGKGGGEQNCLALYLMSAHGGKGVECESVGEPARAQVMGEVIVRMTLKIRCKDERGEVKIECGVRVILRICEGTQCMRAGGEANRIEG